MKSYGKTIVLQVHPERIEIDVNDLEKELEELGINSFFIKQKCSINLYMAKLIAEKYCFGRELRVEEKRGIIYAILHLNLLNKNIWKRLDVFVQRLMECGFSEQEAYGIIINLGVNGKIIDENGCSYRALVSNDRKAFQKLKEHSDRVDKSVSFFTVIIAASDYLNEEEQKRLKNEVHNTGNDIRHIYVAKRMVEEFMSNKSLDNDAKSALIFKLLGLKFETRGRKEKRRTEKRFCKALGLKELPREYSAHVGDLQNISCDLELIDRLEHMYGINRKFLERKSSANIAVAEEIVNGADYGKELTGEEKRALILKLLSNSSFGEKMPDALSIMMDNFQRIGFSKQETYGVIINLFVLGITLGNQTYECWDLLRTNQRKSWKIITDQKAAISTKVTLGPLTWKKLINTGERAMQRAVSRSGKNGDIGKTRDDLVYFTEKTERDKTGGDWSIMP